MGPSGSGKTELILKLLMGNSLLNLEPFISLQRDATCILRKSFFSEIVKFIKFNGFESLGNLENFLLVFDDSCEDIYNDKEFVRLATVVRHRRIVLIYVKHNLFQQI